MDSQIDSPCDWVVCCWCTLSIYRWFALSASTFIKRSLFEFKIRHIGGFFLLLCIVPSAVHTPNYIILTLASKSQSPFFPLPVFLKNSRSFFHPFLWPLADASPICHGSSWVLWWTHFVPIHRHRGVNRFHPFKRTPPPPSNLSIDVY